jgi:hypothetical protein
MDEFGIDAAVDAAASEMDMSSDSDESSSEIEADESQAGAVKPSVEPVILDEVPEATSSSSAPKTWRKDAAAVWDQLPASAQAEIIKREGDIFSGIETYKADANYGIGFKQALAPYLPMMESRGVNPIEHIKGLLSSFDAIERGTPEQKMAIFKQVANDFGIDASSLLQDQPYKDPDVLAVNNHLKQVRKEIQELKSYREQETRSSINSEIENFSKDPGKIYFTELSNDMASLIEKGICSNLKEAYDQAVWLNPNVREKHLSSLNERAAKDTEKAKAEKLKSAKSASASNLTVSAKHGGDTASSPSIDDTIRDTYRAIMAR